VLLLVKTDTEQAHHIQLQTLYDYFGQLEKVKRDYIVAPYTFEYATNIQTHTFYSECHFLLKLTYSKHIIYNFKHYLTIFLFSFRQLQKSNEITL
jgi:hypothetical protein